MKHPHFLLQQTSHQRGSILVQFALLSAVLIIILGTVQIGYMYYAKRDLQRIADIAALESVNALTYGDSSTCTKAEQAGKNSVEAQLHLVLSQEVRQIHCGHWNANKPDAQRFSTSHGSSPVANALNAVRVTLKGETLQLLPFTGSRMVAATAIASKDSEPVAAFSVGSQLLRFNNDGLLGKIASGVGLDINRLTVLDKDGIANAKITPAGLLESLGLPVGVSDLSLLSPNDLANVDASLLDLIDAAIHAGGDNVLNAGVDMGELVRLKTYLEAFTIANIKTPLGGNNGLLAIVSAGGNASPIGAGLDVAVDLAELVRTQLAVANGTNSVALTNTGIPGLAAINLTIVEPPAVAIGPSKPVITKAYNAQVRLNLELLSMGGIPLLGSLLPLPLAVDLTNGEGTLEKISCQKIPHTVDISVESSIGKICLGKLEGTLCKPTEVLLGLVTVKSEVNLLPSSSQTLTDMRVNKPQASKENNLQIGSTLTSLLDGLELKLIGINLGLVTNTVGAILRPALVPILNGLGSFLSGTVLRNILGIELGRTNIEALSIQCDTAQLVY